MTPRRAGKIKPSTSLGFLHDDVEFTQLLQVSATAATLDVEFVEKDYWVTHVLWWLEHERFGVSFKGGTSLSKCFGLIQRFSEDIDVHLVPPPTLPIPTVRSWTPSDTEFAEERLAYFGWLATELSRIPGVVSVRHDVSRHSPRHINAVYYLDYASRFATTGGMVERSVQLEVVPDVIYAAVPCHVTSFIHDVLLPERAAGFIDNRPASLICAHPVATLLGKLDAICNQHRKAIDPARYVRHFEDAHHIIMKLRDLPDLPAGLTVQELAMRMRADNQIRRSYNAQDDAFTLPNPVDRDALKRAHAKLGTWHWGPRVPLLDACATIRDWLERSNLFAQEPA